MTAPESDKRYELTDLSTGKVREVDLATAAQIIEINADEIQWCLEEFGICETDEFQLRQR